MKYNKDFTFRFKYNFKQSNSQVRYKLVFATSYAIFEGSIFRMCQYFCQGIFHVLKQRHQARRQEFPEGGSLTHVALTAGGLGAAQDNYTCICVIGDFNSRVAMEKDCFEYHDEETHTSIIDDNIFLNESCNISNITSYGFTVVRQDSIILVKNCYTVKFIYLMEEVTQIWKVYIWLDWESNPGTLASNVGHMSQVHPSLIKITLDSVVFCIFIKGITCKTSNTLTTRTHWQRQLRYTQSYKLRIAANYMYMYIYYFDLENEVITTNILPGIQHNNLWSIKLMVLHRKGKDLGLGFGGIYALYSARS